MTIILKTPKQKHASSAHLARQAKKRKRIQREDPAKRLQERERENLRRRQHPRSHPISACEANSEERRQRDAEAHRFARLDPERRQQEQQRDTAAHQQVRLHNPQRREGEQERDTIGMYS